MVAPELETFKVEKSVSQLIKTAAKEAKIDDGGYKGRVDLVLSSGQQLVILEFMRPGLKLDLDHLNRFDNYVRIVRTNLKANTSNNFNDDVIGYIVADELENNSAIMDRIKSMEKERMYTMDWNIFFGNALLRWQEFLETLVIRVPDDERLKALL